MDERCIPELPPEAVTFLEGIPESELHPFLWNWMEKSDPRITSMIDNMLIHGFPPEDLLCHGPYQDIPLILRQCLTRTAAWRAAQLRAKG